MSQVVDQIQENLAWLSENNKSNNIVKLSQCLNKLQILAVSFDEEVTAAYETMNDLEDEYKEAVEAHKDELLNQKVSAAAAKTRAEAKFVEKKKLHTQAKNIYKKLNSFQERVDKVVDAYKQYVSNLKDERFYSQGQP